MIVDYSPHFARHELECRYSARCEMQSSFLEKLEAVRIDLGLPMILSSAYRDPLLHPAEKGKLKPGYHALGRAADVLVFGADALRLIEIALRHGMNGIGVSQSSKTPHSERFVHLDDREDLMIWSY